MIRSCVSAACQGDAPHAPLRQIDLSDQIPPGPKELLLLLAAPVQETTAPPAAVAAASRSCPGGQRRRHGRSRVQRCGRSPSGRHHLCRAGACHCRWPACRRCRPGWESGRHGDPSPHLMSPSRRAQAHQWAGRPTSNQQWQQYSRSTPGEVGRLSCLLLAREAASYPRPCSRLCIWDQPTGKWRSRLARSW